MAEKITKCPSVKLIPPEGLVMSAPPGRMFSRIHLDLAQDGITLATVGAASTLSEGNRHHVTLKAGKDGVTLAMVGAASAAKQ